MNSENNSKENETITSDELKLASAYLSSGMIVTDSVKRAAAMTRAIENSQVSGSPCSGWCQETSDTTWIMRYVGNDKEKTRKLQLENLDEGLRCICKACSHKHFEIASVLDHHLDMLRCVSRNDSRGAARAAGRRGDILRRLGYKIA